MEIKWRKHCRLGRLAKDCSVFKFTSAKDCETCGNNLRKPKKTKKKKLTLPAPIDFI